MSEAWCTCSFYGVPGHDSEKCPWYVPEEITEPTQPMRPYQRAAIVISGLFKNGDVKPNELTIEAVLTKYIVPEDAWRNAFAAMAEELGVKTGMSHCSESTFDVLKAIRELKSMPYAGYRKQKVSSNRCRHGIKGCKGGETCTSDHK